MKVPNRTASGPKVIFAGEIEGGEVRMMRLCEWLRGRGVEPEEAYDDEVIYLTFKQAQSFKVWQREETVECTMVHCLVTGQDGNVLKFHPLIGVRSNPNFSGVQHIALDPSTHGVVVGDVMMKY
jgi:hypothetical protein